MAEELKEGGEEEEWFDFEQFWNELNQATIDESLTAEQAQEIIHKVFHKIKRWMVFNGENMVAQFRNVDSKGSLIVKRNGLQSVLNTIMKPKKPTKQELNAIFLAYDPE
jgi:hypothetical protein